MRIPLALSTVAVMLLGCGDPVDSKKGPAAPSARVDEARLAGADGEPQNWYATDRGIGEDHYSPLDQIHEGNVGSLGFAWQYATGTSRGLEASPLVIDGVMYTSGNWGVVYALDAATGAEIWKYDPKVPGEWARKACCDVVNRGVAAWKGRIYVASLDGYLISLDAASGRPLWRQDTFVDRSRSMTITGAPQIAGDKVVIGNSGAELGVRGYISAYDVSTGELAWRFYTVPGDPRKPFEHPELEWASKTWDRDSMWDVGGGGTVWDAMAYDPALNLLYVGTGNGSPLPAYSRSPKGGDNLFLSSILAINPDDGRLAWHYQTTPGDTWDYTATQHLILADLQMAGKPRKVLMQAPKNGFFYVLDRATGELLSAEKYSTVTWASHVDPATGKPVLTGQADYSKQPKIISPGTWGAHNWHPMSYSPRTGLVYIPVIDEPEEFVYTPEKAYRPGEYNEHVQYSPPQVVNGKPARIDYLLAWDPVAGRERWRLPVALPANGGGVLSTAGNLVFKGSARGFLDVYAADTGAQLASLNVGTGMIAAPISYAVNGEQYVAIMAGVGGAGFWTFPESSAAYRYGNAGRIVAFKLGGGPVPLPQKVDRVAVPPEPPEVPTSPEMVARGSELFPQLCSHCHAWPGDPPGLLPNLFALTREKHSLFEEIVLRGAFQAKGMASFADVLNESDVAALHAYIVEETRKRIAEGVAR